MQRFLEVWHKLWFEYLHYESLRTLKPGHTNYLFHIIKLTVMVMQTNAFTICQNIVVIMSEKLVKVKKIQSSSFQLSDFRIFAYNFRFHSQALHVS